MYAVIGRVKIKPGHEDETEATFNTLRDMPDAPATFISVDVCEVIGQA